MKRKKLLIYTGFFTVLLAGFYFLVFRDYNFSASPLKVINANIADFKFTTQDGDTLVQKDLDDKVYVAEYFFTTCKGICPKMNTNMRRVWNEYKNEEQFAILSHTCMPEVDSLPLLKQYEKQMINGILVNNFDGTYKLQANAMDTAKNKNWYFLTGNKTDLYKMARQGYMIDDGKPDSTTLIKDQFIHTQFFALVDKNHRVRGIYDGLKGEEVTALIADIRGLLKEKITTKRFMTGFSNNPG